MENRRFETREDVRNFLPDILGKTLARIWIDPEFHNNFASNPLKALAENGVMLPENIVVDFQKQDSQRPRVVVFEQKPGSKFKLRIFYLQLVMMAGR
jgi:16S rRNA G966 N2-methylase RsmD